jgi:hypothetical protein
MKGPRIVSRRSKLFLHRKKAIGEPSTIDRIVAFGEEELPHGKVNQSNHP